LTTTTTTRKWEMSLCCPWLDINRLACLMNRKKCESCFFVFIFLLLCFSSLILYACMCMCVVYRSKSANNETIRHWSPTFSQGRKIKLFCCFILSYHTFLPSSLQRTYVYCVRWKKGVSHNFCPGQLVSLFWSLCFEEKNVSFCFCFCCNCLRWVETSSYFLLRICSRVAFYINFFLFFWTQDQSRLTSNYCCNDSKDMRNFDFLVIYFWVAFCNNDFNLKPGLIFFKFFKNRGF
jgi:hypothetical protein